MTHPIIRILRLREAPPSVFGADGLTVPRALPGPSWVIDEFDSEGKLLKSRQPTAAEVDFLSLHPAEGFSLQADHELAKNRKLMSDPDVVLALQNLRRMRYQ